MSTQTKTFESLRQLKDGLPSLPDDAVIRDSDGDEVPRRDIPMMSGSYSPYAVTYEVPTPAPLDPAAVKAGDTVTLENGDTSVRGPVVNVEKALPTDVTLGFAIKNVGWRYLAPGVVAQQDSGVWTLTDHQPAPEPLPTAHGSIVRVELAEYVLVGREWLHTQFGNPVSVETMQTQDWTLVRDAGAMFA